MSDRNNPLAPGLEGPSTADHDDESPPSSEGDDSLRALLRGALADAPPDEPAPREDTILRGVQARLRERSGGRFYGLGWGEAPEAPIATYLVSSLFILAAVIVLYASLSPATASAVVLPPLEVRLVPAR
jgi:hypothetical protein